MLIQQGSKIGDRVFCWNRWKSIEDKNIRGVARITVRKADDFDHRCLAVRISLISSDSTFVLHDQAAVLHGPCMFPVPLKSKKLPCANSR